MLTSYQKKTKKTGNTKTPKKSTSIVLFFYRPLVKTFRKKLHHNLGTLQKVIKKKNLRALKNSGEEFLPFQCFCLKCARHICTLDHLRQFVVCWYAVCEKNTPQKNKGINIGDETVIGLSPPHKKNKKSAFRCLKKNKLAERNHVSSTRKCT